MKGVFEVGEGKVEGLYHRRIIGGKREQIAPDEAGCRAAVPLQLQLYRRAEATSQLL